jgi:hypothetical protein
MTLIKLHQFVPGLVLESQMFHRAARDRLPGMKDEAGFMPG